MFKYLKISDSDSELPLVPYPERNLSRDEINQQLCQLRAGMDLNTVDPVYSPPQKTLDTLTLLKNITLEYQSYLEKLINQDDFKYTSKEEVIYKLRACNHLLEIDNVKEFKTLFNFTKKHLEKSRDTGTMKFIKGIVTVFTMGLAALFGIWDVKGKKATNQIEAILEKKPSR